MAADCSEQRRFPRFHYSVPIKYRQKDEVTPTYTVTRDISIGGLKILTNRFIPRGTDMAIEIEIPRDNVINAAVNVIWSNRISHSDQYLSGVKFSEIDEVGKKNISELVSYALKH